MLTPAIHRTRALNLLMLAAFGGIALWLFLPGKIAFEVGSGSVAALPPSLKVDGEVQVTSEAGVVRHLVVPLAVRGNDGVVLTDGSRIRAETFMSETAAAVVPAKYTLTWLDGNGDNVLDPGEHAQLSVDLPEKTTVHPENPLRLVLRPIDSVALVIEDVLE